MELGMSLNLKLYRLTNNVQYLNRQQCHIKYCPEFSWGMKITPEKFEIAYSSDHIQII